VKPTVSGTTTHMLKIWQQLINHKEEGQLLKKLRAVDQIVLISRYQGVGEGILYLPERLYRVINNNNSKIKNKQSFEQKNWLFSFLSRG